MSESKESSEQQVTQWNVQRLVMPWPPCFYTQRCICLSEIGPHSFYVTKCCQQPMHRKCFFNLIDEALAGNEIGMHCPFCRSDKYVDEQCGRDYLTTRGYPMLDGMSSELIMKQLMCLRAIVNKKGRNDAMHMAVMLSLDRKVAMHAFRTFF